MEQLKMRMPGHSWADYVPLGTVSCQVGWVYHWVCDAWSLGQCETVIFPAVCHQWPLSHTRLCWLLTEMHVC